MINDLNNYKIEEILKNCNDEYCCMVADVAKRTRTDHCYDLSEELAGCLIGGPIVYTYVLWVILCAVRDGVEQLFFIARDGYILKKVAEIIINSRKLNITCEYIYGSRRAWRYYDGTTSIYEYIREYVPADIRSIKELAEVLCIDERDLHCFEDYIKVGNSNKIELEYIFSQIDNDDILRKKIVAGNNEKKDLFNKYLLQIDGISNENGAFVDTVGSGLTQSFLYKQLKQSGAESIRTYYFKCKNERLFQGCENISFYNGNENMHYIELICRAPHGQTQGYVDIDGVMTPVLSNDDSYPPFDKFCDGVVAFSRNMELQLNGINIFPGIVIFEEIGKYIHSMPDKELWEYFANIPFSKHGYGCSALYAPKVQKEEIEDIFYFGSKPYSGADIKYASVLCTDEEKLLIEKYSNDPSSPKNIAIREKSILREKYGSASLFDLNRLSGRTAIYGAGKYGRNLHRYICENGRDISVVAWFDKAAAYDSDETVNPNQIQNYEFEQIIIAVRDICVAAEIYGFLTDQGVGIDKIMWIE